MYRAGRAHRRVQQRAVLQRPTLLARLLLAAGVERGLETKRQIKLKYVARLNALNRLII